MLTKRIHISILGICLLFSVQIMGQDSANLNITFENITSDKGTVRVAVYASAEDFMDMEKAKLYTFEVNEPGQLQAQIDDLKPGTYAFASFHDENNDDDLDTNFFGIPKEPYCFSRQCPSKWRPPTFEEAKIELSEGGNEVKVSMQRWQF